VHGITAEMVAEAPELGQVLPGFLEFIGDWPLVAHNAGFDLAFLNRALGLHGRPALANEVYDSLEMAREVFPEQRSHKLESLCRLLGHPAENFHRALDDTQHLAAIFPVLLALYRQKQGWYRAQFERIQFVAQRYDQLSRLIEALQNEQADMRRVLTHYFNENPDARVGLPGGEALVRNAKENWDYDTDALMPLLESWGLKEKFLKLDRARLERWLLGDRLTPEQKEHVAATRLLLGVNHRISKQAPERAAEPTEPA
jgi:DNA polymerase III epsilon subunit-like protein